jgi:probable rRNA maturation factor
MTAAPRIAVSLPALDGPRAAALLEAGVPAARPLGVLLRRAARAVLEAEDRTDLELSLTLLDDDAMRELNRDWLGHDRPTDVIAFALGEGDAEPLGDVYIGAGRAVDQAGEAGVGVREELVRLAVHGTLHVLGYDHDEGPARVEGAMWRRQEELVKRILGDE